ncbi:hypothetical protein IQ258_19615 [Coleofasciculus sp. LEGE 07081]|uniref:hypothetical protein n=1 Tax=Coleofasciculus sp. LEGE 07081 TaxID=2777967 RepID=UPI00187ECD79|nr:hypothetical protein [Coleofasciculus sp. LEGE 07081]MBE9128311.1 hypothetical protein [Coleofasciculus sp. LEGE 07081]
METPYAVTLGMVEALPAMQAPIPPELTGPSILTKNAAYSFQEFAVDDVNGTISNVNLAGETIDWSQSQLDSTGQVALELGIVRPYELKPKQYSERKYTFLSLALAYDDEGESKSLQWTVRMRHF